ncbi:MAG: NAD+ synthase [Spirochaetes bacterium GWD1_61_31]|nr:MAG: NAD+ synthase [Spirochaetes bacterium GWB1_60_80]OHD35346.1 MAG: NAD+ synthase [Spirochaetes bacterium GWC1_61_12]OHD36115.1 MAG: NAD+ synthase [Spirochaetes bacterium GWD1_61_31]OHD45002.1 MAG: NAD+ synthase [Spirochaetes bacterium GWE1_60_18]OHD60112.1 MAG: NAD+ synthase [Spirochaetes bacterium GWF1_60_12]HAP43681.1 NAD+ synthase [Spirochaetaceae bacterium]
MQIALIQLDSTVGDFPGNLAKAIKQIGLAAAAGAELAVLPELALCGYAPMDLLDQDAFIEQDERAFRQLQDSAPANLAVAVGHIGRNPSHTGRRLRNVVSVILNGQVVFEQAKTLLPNYDVFDETRYFEPATVRAVFNFGGFRLGFAICEDIWYEAAPSPGLHYPVDPLAELLDAGADCIIVPSASPYQLDKLALRVELCRRLARTGGVPVAYCNTAGANDSLVFDGRSFVLDNRGQLVQLAGFGESLLLADLLLDDQAARPPAADNAAPALPHRLAELESALVAGIRGYMAKCGFKKAHLGLSGGIDSAIVAVLVAKAIGPENLTCISLPSRYSSEGSVNHSRELCAQLNCRLETIAIEGPFSSLLSAFAPYFTGLVANLTEENLQARIRGVLLMGWSNKFDSLLLTTGNKSEIAVGYCTLYGDMCGGFNPIGDLFKTEVYELCEYIHATQGLIPRSIIDKAPSAELRPNQTDQDSLPPYPLLDAILRLHIESNLDRAAIVAQGFDSAIVSRVLTLCARAEYKRRQAAPLVKVSPRAFGLGRRIPMARAIHEL